MTQNVQNLPAGLAGRVAAATTAPAPAPTPAPEPTPVAPVAPVDQGPAVPNAPAATAPTVPTEPVAAPVNPMLSSASQPKPEAAQQAAPATEPELQAPDVPVPEKTDKAATTVAELAGTMANDSHLAPAVSYLDAVMKENGLDINRALGQAAEELDPRFIDRNYLIEKLGAEKAETIIKVATDTLVYVEQYTQQSLNQVYAAAGGQQQFKAAVDAFNTKADPTERAMYAELLNSGDRQKMIFAARKIAEYGVQAGVVIRHNAQPLGTAGSQQGLSREEYAKAIQERNLSPERYEQLKSLRKLGMAQGR